MDQAVEATQSAAKTLIESGILGALVVALGIALGVAIVYFNRREDTAREREAKVGESHDDEIKSKDDQIKALFEARVVEQRDALTVVAESTKRLETVTSTFIAALGHQK